MRRFPLVAVMVALVAAVLAVSLWTMRRAGEEALREFGAAQSGLAKDAGAALRGYLDSFDRDTRLLAELAQGTRRQAIERPAQDRAILDAFQALATVVRHYRTIALYSDGAAPIVAVDPTEDRATIAPALVAASAGLAREAAARRSTMLRGPLRLGSERSFYLYAAPTADGAAVVVTADAAMMLEVVSRAPSDARELVVADPSGAVWLGCQQRQRCRLFDPGSPEGLDLLVTIGRAVGHAPAEVDAALARLGLPDRIVAGRAALGDTPLGAWSVALLASAADIDVRQGAFLRQLVLTCMAVAAAMLTVGFFMLRQHATAAALGARLQAAEEVATLRERSEKILENVPVGIVGIGFDGMLATANRFFQERIAPATDGAANAEALIRWAAKQEDYRVRVVPLGHPGTEIAWLVVVEDLSELHGLQRQLVRAEKLITVGVLSAGIAHEVGTPLMVIRGRAEHLLESTPEGPVAEALKAIVDQIDRISSTIHQVLEFSREQPIEVGPADAGEAIDKAIEMLAWRVSSKRIAARLRRDDQLPPIAAAPHQFEQVAMNLLMNACDASETGGAVEVVLTRAGAEPGHLRLEITDHGVGIPPEHLNAVFDPYFTTKKRGEGTGLGLAIVSQIVRSHGGTISLSSTVGAGTTATVSWPLAGLKSADA